MTLAEHGVYNILLDTAWEEEPVATIPKDIYILNKLTAIRPQILRNFVAKYAQLWSDFAADSRRLVNPRLRAEYEEFLEQCEKKRFAGIASGKARLEQRTLAQQTLNNSDKEEEKEVEEEEETEFNASAATTCPERPEKPTPAPDSFNPWKVLGSDLSMGCPRFQKLYEHYFAARSGNPLSDAMERTIQAANGRGIKVPPPFFDAKRIVERREAEELSNCAIDAIPELEAEPWAS
jgi:uncharacterized protein YdaU (DUF1376 family)